MNPIERTARRIDAFQQRRTATALAFGVVKKYGDDNAGVLVNNLAFTAFITVFPLLLILVTVLGLVLASDNGLRQSLLHSTLAQFPVVGKELGGNIHSLRRSSTIGLVVGILLLVWGSLGLAQAGLFSMSQVWNLPGPERPNFIARVGRSMAFLGVLGLGLVVSTFLASFGTFGRHDVVLGALGEALAVLVNCGQYLLAFRVLTPKVVPTAPLVPGAVAGGVAWTVLLAVGGYLVGHDLRNDGATYGTFATVLGLVAWIYLGVKITIYAAELNTVLAHRLWPRGMVQPPLTEADQRVLALQATESRARPDQKIEVSFTEPPQSQERWLDDGPPAGRSAEGAESPVTHRHESAR